MSKSRKVAYLEAEVPLTKSFWLENGQLQKSAHPLVMDCTSHIEEYNTIDEFGDIMRRHAAAGHCLVKNIPTRELHQESRRGTTDPNAPTDYMCLDLDGLKALATPDALLEKVGFADADHALQYSASSGIVPDRGLSAHIFLLLSEKIAPSLLKLYLMHWNLTIPELRKDLKLARSGNAIRWPLDISTCQNDKLIYVAPPQLGEGVKDEFVGDRIQVIKRKHREVKLPPPPNAETVRKLAAEALDQLRAAQGLEPKKYKYKTHGGVEYQVNPDVGTLTGIKSARGYVYMNLNGGDSWGYFHPERNPDILYNFKGEPNYLMKDILPDYWRQAQKELMRPKEDEKGNIYLAFIDFKSARYFYAIVNGRTMTIAQAKNPDQLRGFCMQFGQPVPEFFPMYNLVYEPGMDYIVDHDAMKVNLYRPSDIMMRKDRREVKEVPPMVRKVLMHAVGDDEEAFEHFNNWFACIVKYHRRTNTAWIWHGVQGTGKGLMLEHIIRPILGRHNVVTNRIQDMEDRFNPRLEHCQLLWLEESDAEAMKNAKLVDANFKSYITEGMISIRPMFATAFEAPNHINVIVSSNKDQPMIVDVHDRRYNVGAFQAKRLDITPAEVQKLEEEAFDYYCYLMERDADTELARQALNNGAKQEMIYLNRQAIDVAIDAVKNGDLQYFIDQKHPSPDQIVGGFDAKELAVRYNQLVDEMKDHQALSRDELQVLLNFVVGNVPAQPAKFTSMMKRHGIKTMNIVRRGDKVFRGVRVEWKT